MHADSAIRDYFLIYILSLVSPMKMAAKIYYVCLWVIPILCCLNYIQIKPKAMMAVFLFLGVVSAAALSKAGSS